MNKKETGGDLMDAKTDKPPPQVVNEHDYLLISMNISLTDWWIDKINYL